MRNFLLLIVVAVVVLFMPLQADKTYKNIVVISFLDKKDADNSLKTLNKLLGSKPEMVELQKQYGFKYISRASGKFFIVSIEPFRNDKIMNRVLMSVRKKFPDAFVYTHWDEESVQPPPKIIEKEVVVIEKVRASHDAESERMMWLAVVALAFIGLVLIIRLSRQKSAADKLKNKMTKQQKEMQESISMQDDLLVNVSQKIQSPVKEIIGRSEKILQGQLDPKQANELKMIKYSDGLLLDITNDLIDFLKLKSGTLRVKRAAFNINNVLDEVAGMVSARARGSEVEFIFDIEKNVPARLVGDPLRLSQILINLLSNAMKFTKEGEVKLKVKRIDNPNADVMLEFDITDTGIGIKKERLDDIFMPFSEANDDSQTGMGLYISKKLAELMGGDIRLDSTHKKGTEFIITVALSMPDLNEKRHYRLPSKSYTNHKFLIIDHHYDAALALKKMLEYFRNEVTHRFPRQFDGNYSELAAYEVVFIAENVFTPKVIDAIKEIKGIKKIKIVSIGKMLSLKRSDPEILELVDRSIMKPFSQQRIMELVVSLFDEKADSKSAETLIKEVKKAEEIVIEDVPVEPGVTKESFTAFAGSSILIAEDNVINQKVLTGLLGSSGIKLKIANDGQEALGILDKGERFDLVLMDINMPVMDGYEATRHIRMNPDYEDLPVVSLTGLGLPEEIKKMYAIGMSAHLIKPLQVGALYTVFKQHLKFNKSAVKSEKKSDIRNYFKNGTVLSAKDGLDRASGDMDLYLEIIREFVNLYGDAGDRLNTMVAKDALDDAKKLCLDIRGVAANIGAYQLSETAQQMQETIQLHNGKDALSLMVLFKKQLSELLDELDRLLKDIS